MLIAYVDASLMIAWMSQMMERARSATKDADSAFEVFGLPSIATSVAPIQDWILKLPSRG